ncbi:hypothetical protein COLO4_30061 [Corchorus olitorius]|uniref:Uncharacterized protein n=1 Tax=Corchorus olitorius TaxID=93759 RepID=A0A1R3HBA8_9ROSI|nr:hypothetical protein COLO4_30061 [Corchorus olitorius]
MALDANKERAISRLTMMTWNLPRKAGWVGR